MQVILRFNLLHALADVCIRTRQWQPATAISDELLMWAQALGPASFQTAEVLDMRGVILSEQGFFAEARGELERAIEIMKQHQAPDSAVIAWATVHLADALGGLEQFEAARDALTQALAVFEQRHLEDSGGRVRVLTTLVAANRALGDEAAAKAAAARLQAMTAPA